MSKFGAYHGINNQPDKIEKFYSKNITEPNQRNIEKPAEQPTNMEELLIMHLVFTTEYANSLTTGGNKLNMDNLR